VNLDLPSGEIAAVTDADADGALRKLACGRFAIGWDTMQPNWKDMQRKPEG